MQITFYSTQRIIYFLPSILYWNQSILMPSLGKLSILDIMFYS